MPISLTLRAHLESARTTREFVDAAARELKSLINQAEYINQREEILRLARRVLPPEDLVEVEIAL